MSPKRMLRVALALSFLVAAGGGLTACNTVEGVGEDISSTGRYLKEKMFGDSGGGEDIGASESTGSDDREY